jgi:hypothetical protein
MELTLKSLLATLGKINVSGKDNLDMLLGCIQTVEGLLEVCKKVQQKEGEVNGTAGQQLEGV